MDERDFLLWPALLLVGAGLTLRLGWKRPGRLRRFLANLLLLLTSVFVTFALLELLVGVLVVESDGFGFTLSNRRWGARYWKPINSWGLRDVQHTAEQLRRQRVVVVAGDSVAAGYGVKRMEDRFSSVLQARLGDGYRVVNLAAPSWSTSDERQVVEILPGDVHMVALVLSYFLNDIEGAAQEVGRSCPVGPPPPWLQPLVRRSALLDFAYWRWYRASHPDPGRAYWRCLQGLFSSDEVWQVHRRELLWFADFARRRGARFVFLLHPNYADLPGSRPLTARVARLMREAGATVIDLHDTLAGWRKQDLVVSSIDAHPSVRVHREVGRLLYEVLAGTP